MKGHAKTLRHALSFLTADFQTLGDLKNKSKLDYVAFNDLAQEGKAIERRTPIIKSGGIQAGEKIEYALK